MRCSKCGYVTFDGHENCPKCGRDLPDSLVATALRKRPRKAKSGLFLSPLVVDPVPRYYGSHEDPEVVSLLGVKGLLASSPAATLPPVRDLEEEPPVSDVPEAEPASAEPAEIEKSLEAPPAESGLSSDASLDDFNRGRLR